MKIERWTETKRLLGWGITVFRARTGREQRSRVGGGR